MIKYFIAFFFLTNAFAKVDPPNYDFSLDSLKTFMPETKLSAIMQEYKTSEVVLKEGAYTTYKFDVEHLRYKFPVLVQVINGVVTDFYARLPYYFLHDIFHQSLINRYGAQDFYQKTEESAIYIWKNKNNFNHIYSGACTITCFPIYYSVYPVKHNYGGGFKPLIKRLNEGAKF